MRCCFTLLIAAVAAVCLAQQPPQPADGQPTPVRPDVLIYVHGDTTGANVVEISMVDENYPSDLLQKQINDLCDRLKVPARGLRVVRSIMQGNNQKVLAASFGTVGLEDSEGNANLTPLIQAFAGAPAPYTIKGMEVFYDDFNPPIKGPKSFRSQSVTVDGRMDMNPPQVEYAIRLLTQNPGEILVSSKPPKVEPTSNRPQAGNSNSVLVWCLILIGGMAAGSLVYFLLIRRLSGSSSTSVLRKH